jgi:hypothetical protein
MSTPAEIEIEIATAPILVETAEGVTVEIASAPAVVEIGGVPGPQGPPGEAGDVGLIVDGGNF